MASKRGPRVLIATLFLPETVSFEDTPQPTPSLQHTGEPRRSSDPTASSSEPGTGGGQVPFPASSSSRPGKPSILSPIHSGHASPQNAGSAAATPTRSQSGSDAGRFHEPSQDGSLALSSIATPAPGNALDSNSLAPSAALAGGRPKLPQRGMSIVQDLQAKRTGPTTVTTPKMTPSDMELGANPFETTALATPAPAPMTPSLQSSIASKRPATHRLTSEGSGPSASLTATLKERLERLHGAATGAKDRATSIIGASGVPATPGQREDNGGYFGKGALSSLGASSPGLLSPRSRRRSSSTSRGSSFSSTGPPPLTRAFSRKGKTDHRRRSSASAETALAAGIPKESPEVPPFHFESNPHGNGGLQNAVRSVADVHVRTSSEPTPAPFAKGAATSVRSNGIPGIRTTIGEYLWIGTPGCGIEDFDDPLRRVVEKRYKDEKQSVVVWIEDDVLEPAYDSFCKQNLWPTFHYQIHDAHKTKAYESPTWKDYIATNQAFADKIVANYREGDLIWVNDYHLLLVPQMVRSQLPHATIGFFLHINFPSSEIFRCFAVRKELLRGVLGADLIGFQTYNTARHFRQTCQRLLSVEATPKGIQLDSGFARVGVFPIGIDVKALHERKEDSEVHSWVQELRERYKGVKVLIARDKLDEIKGVRQKLCAFEAFLERFPEWQGKVVLIQVAMATSAENEKQGEVMDVVSRINARFSTFTYQPVVFLHQDVSFSQYLALLTIADAFINASLREGMNLTSHEYIICQTGSWGPLILSEFTGSYSRAGFQRCIPINPYDKLQCARAINEALTMPEDEKISRWRDLERHVWSQTAQHWCTGFLHALQREVVDVRTRPLLSPLEAGSVSADLPPPFDAKEAVAAFSASRKRLILLDLEGTLCPDNALYSKADGPSSDGTSAVAFKLTDAVMKSLDKLASDSQNVIYIMSGRSSSSLEDLGRQLPKVGFVAENGCYATLPLDKKGGERQWHKLVSGAHDTWRAPVLEILQYYTERTPGSCIEDRGISIVWRYANTGEKGTRGVLGLDNSEQSGNSLGDHDAAPKYVDGKGNEAYRWARRQAAEVQNHVMDALGERFGLQLYPGATSFLILPRKAGRAIAVAHILQSDDFSEVAIDDPTQEQAIELEAEGENVEAERREEQKEDAAIYEREGETATDLTEDRDKALHRDVSKAEASKKLLESYDYVLSMGEDQRLCGWLEEMALDKVVTVSVGEKRRDARWRLRGAEEVEKALKILAGSQ